MITDDEIALIKAMMKRGMKIADIQFHFNRQDRPVNTGRFADIRAGRYGRSAEIAEASEEKLQAYLDDYAAGRAQIKVVKPDPLAPATLKSLFVKIGRGTWRLEGNETDRIECKESFHPRGQWLRSLGALANNQGGYILFGVRDNDVDAGQLIVVGMRDDLLFTTDPQVLTRRIRSAFDPTPVFRIGKVEFGKKVVGAIYVEPHPARPVVATKNEGDVSEGDIYYRYPGQSLKIKYSDLRTLLDERDARVRAELQPMLNRLVQLGPMRAMVADLATNELTDGRRSIRISKELADKLSFIKEGHFVERTGAPALRLIGDVHMGHGAIAVKKGIVSREDMIVDFLYNRSRADPIDYLRFAIEMSSREWLPIRHFARLAGMNNAQLITFIDESKGRPANKETFKDRMRNADAAFQEPTGSSAIWLSKIVAGEELKITNAKEAGDVGRALQGINDELFGQIERLRTIAGNCIDVIGGETSLPSASYIRRGIARLDEIIDKNVAQ